MKRVFIVASSVALLFAAFLAVPAGAVEPYSVTFSSAFQVPGAMLPAGTYHFRATVPRVLQVMSSDQRTIYATFMTSPQYRSKATAKTVVVFAETPEGIAPAVSVWFPPFEHTGLKFEYAESPAWQFAQLR